MTPHHSPHEREFDSRPSTNDLADDPLLAALKQHHRLIPLQNRTDEDDQKAAVQAALAAQHPECYKP